VYSVVYGRSSRKELDLLHRPMIGRVHAAITRLAENPRPHGCKMLVGEDNLWRIRIGDYRVIYTIDDQSRVVTILLLGGRDQICLRFEGSAAKVQTSRHA